MFDNFDFLLNKLYFKFTVDHSKSASEFEFAPRRTVCLQCGNIHLASTRLLCSGERNRKSQSIDDRSIDRLSGFCVDVQRDARCYRCIPSRWWRRARQAANRRGELKFITLNTNS